MTEREHCTGAALLLTGCDANCGDPDSDCCGSLKTVVDAFERERARARGEALLVASEVIPARLAGDGMDAHLAKRVGEALRQLKAEKW